ncbi:MAG: UbiA family prenyltransferase [Blastocatellales bacterium]
MIAHSLTKTRELPAHRRCNRRWWTYQRERFPVVAHGVLIAAFSFSAVSYSSLLRGSADFPAPGSAIAAFITSFIFFLQLRIADEFKDAEEDARYRPYRPVPRGLITLRELGVVGAIGASIQLALALARTPALALWLALVWLYLGLMSKEFFAREWLKARPITYLWTHILIMPLIDFYATACDWATTDGSPPAGLGWFLAVSFGNGLAIEIGRKTRAPQDEEHGVPTYTSLWGRRNAAIVWIGALGLSAVCAVFAAHEIEFAAPVALLLAVLLSNAALIAIRFLRQPATERARLFELMSGVWTLLVYLALGAAPLWSKIK